VIRGSDLLYGKIQYYACLQTATITTSHISLAPPTWTFGEFYFKFILFVRSCFQTTIATM